MSNHQENHHPTNLPGPSNPSKRLEKLLSQPGNRVCADCGSPDPKWVSLSHGVFVCIKCSGIHRSLGVHISKLGGGEGLVSRVEEPTRLSMDREKLSGWELKVVMTQVIAGDKVLSVKLDEWTDGQVNSLVDGGGNAAVNMRYEALLPEDIQKPKPDASIEERTDFIRRKYELQQFSHEASASSMTSSLSLTVHNNVVNNKYFEKQNTGIRHGLGHAFRNSWRRKESEQKAIKMTMGMVEFVGLIKVNIIRGTNLAVRDVVTSDPYVILTLGHQTMKTRVVKSNLNPVWNERLMLSIPDPVPPLRLRVYDKDTFSTDDKMGEAEIDIQPLVAAAKAYENSSILEPMQLGKWLATVDNTLVKDSIISLVDGKVKQEITLKLQNVERGQLEMELECVPLSQ